MDRSSGRREGFLRMGITKACLKEEGIEASERQRLSNFVIGGRRDSREALSSHVGRRSREQ